MVLERLALLNVKCQIGVCVWKRDIIHEVLRNESVATAVLLTV
jgi:hypothetical protein